MAAEAPRRGFADDRTREFFIVGCPRSGTTLLRRMLDSHFEISVTPETHFGVNYVRNRRRFGIDGAASARRALLDDFCRSDGFREMAIGGKLNNAGQVVDDPRSKKTTSL